MKRRLFKLGWFLLLGAIVNIAVAWGCAVTSPRSSLRDIQTELPDAETKRLWRKYIGEPDDAYYYFGVSSSIHGTSIIFLGSFPPFGPTTMPDYSQTAEVLRAGWPFRSLEGAIHFKNDMEKELEKDKYWKSNLISLHPLPWPERTYFWYGHVPTRPIWPGFAINTIFYSVLLWLLTVGPFTARRMIRRKRGRCIKCGYDLRGHSGGEKCPECGNELSTSAKP